MKTHPHVHHLARLLWALLALASLTAPSFGQQMPQDNWASYGLQFTSPAPNATLNAIATGTGGVYVGEGLSYHGPYTSILQFTQGGVFVRRFATTLGNVAGLACDPSGNVYCFDIGNSTVNVFDPNGTFLRQWGSTGTANGQFSALPGYIYPSEGIGVDKNGQVYVCDPGNSRVQVFDSNGNFLRKWGQAGSLPSQFNGGVTPTAIATSLDGRVITDGNSYIITDTNGNFIATERLGIGYETTPPLQCTADGVLAVQATNYYDQPGFEFVDAQYSPLISYFPAPNGNGFAFSNRGDLYTVSNTSVTVYQRQYSNVQNSLSPPAIPQPIVLDSAQRAGTSWMDIDYQVTDADSPTVSTATLAFVNGGTTLAEAVPMSTFMEGTGANLGANQQTGTSIHLTWNMAADWTVDYSQVQVEVLSNDGRNLLGFHWITVPASGSNPSIQVSANSTSDAVLLDVWFWLIASHQAGISLSNGTITGTADPYNGVVLATTSGTYPGDVSTTTTAGRQYLYGLLNVRAIAPAEITQAQGGNYGFTSVDANSVVKLP